MNVQHAVRVGRDVVLVLLAAYTFAARQGRSHVGTQEILATASRRGAVGEWILPHDVGRPLRRVLRGPVSDQAADGARLPIVDDFRDEVDATLREVRWRARYQFGRRLRAGEVAAPGPAWTDGVRLAIGYALGEARAGELPRAGAMHLLIGLLASDAQPPDGSAASAIVRDLRSRPPQLAEEYAPVVSSLDLVGALDGRGSWLAQMPRRWLGKYLARRTGYQGSVLACLELELMRQAVRLDNGDVTSAHAVLAVLSLDEQLAATAKVLAPRVTPFNGGGEVLLRAGVDHVQALEIVRDWPATEPGRGLSPASLTRRAWVLGQPTWSAEATAMLEKSIDLAREYGHSEAGTSHLLSALLDSWDGTAGRLLSAMGVDEEEMVYEVNRLLSAT